MIMTSPIRHVRPAAGPATPGIRRRPPAARVLAAAIVGLCLIGGTSVRAATLYEALGEQPGLTRLVDALMRHTLADDRISRLEIG